MVNVLNGEEIKLTTAFNFDNSDLTDKIFFFGYSNLAPISGGGNLVLVKDENSDIFVFTCDSTYPLLSLSCSDSGISFGGGTTVRFDHVPNS